MSFLLAAVPTHRNPHAEDEVARHVEQQHEQEPPYLHLELEVRLVLDVHPDEVERDAENQEHDRWHALCEDEQEHGGHPTTGAAR
jgi:hypothetical protein